MAGEVKLDVLQTERRGHAAEAAAQAVRDGIELVVAHGGDGTLNEVVNGVLAAIGRPRGRPARRPGRRHRPRRLGQRVRPRPRRPGRPDGGHRAAVGAGQPPGEQAGRPRPRAARRGRARPVVHVQRRAWAGTPRSSRPSSAPGPRAGRPRRCATPPPPCASTSGQRRRPHSMTVDIAGAAAVADVRLAFVSTTDTWTYLGSRAVRTNPGSVIGAGLGVFGLRDLGAGTVASTLRHILRTGGDPHGRNVLRQDAVGHVRVGAARAGRPAGRRRTPGSPPGSAVSCGNRCATRRRVRRTVSGPQALCHHTHG